MIAYIHCSYKIIEKEETKVLLRFLNEIHLLQQALRVMTFTKNGHLEDDEEDAIEIFDRQIQNKLIRMYRYYSRKYGIKFDDYDWGADNIEFPLEYRINKTITDNISKICEATRSWEE